MSANSAVSSQSCVKCEQPSAHIPMTQGVLILQQGQLCPLEGVLCALVSSAAGATGIKRSAWTGANNKPMLTKLANVKRAIKVRGTIR